MTRASLFLLLSCSGVVACHEVGTSPPPPPPLAAAKVAFTVQPANATAGVAFAPPVVVTVEDSLNRVVIGASNAVTVKLDTGLAGLSGTATVTAVNGVATFADLALQKAGSGYFLTASSPGLARATSASFAIAPAAPSALAFTVQPSTTDSAAVIAPAVQVAIQDPFANPVPSATNAVTIAIANNPGGATLSGTTTVRAVNGVATFSDLSLNQGGNGYTFVATASGLAKATSTSFKIRVPFALAAVSAGGGYTCGVTRVGSAYCWGKSSGGELGSGDTTGGGGSCLIIWNPFSRTWSPCSPSPVAVSGGLALGVVSAGAGQTCGITRNGTAYCWGMGALGNGTPTGPQHCLVSTSQDYRGHSSSFWLPCSATPLAVSGGLTFVALSTGGSLYTCALTSTGAAYCWGANAYGQLGTGDTTNRSQPVVVSGGLTFVSVVAGGSHTCGVTRAGAAYCWGSNVAGELGNGTTTKSSTPVAVSGGIVFAALSAGTWHTCGVTGAGSAYCWGDNRGGELGNGTTTNSSTPVAVSGGMAFTGISAGGYHTCALTSVSAAYCWGSNNNSLGGAGDLGDGTTTDRATPVAVSGGILFTGISAGGSHTCGVTSPGAVYCWGLNRTGQLGNGTAGISSYSSVPVHVY